MKKKKQQTRNLIVLAVVTVGIVLGLWAMNSKFSFNSKAAGANCFSGIYMKGGDKKCYEVQAQCGAKCCNKVVDNSKCKDSKYKYKEGQIPPGQGEEKYGLKCPGTGYSWFGTTDPTCYLLDGEVRLDNNNVPGCYNKKVPNKFCE